MSISELRREYHRTALDERTVDPDPVRQFQRWLADALTAKLTEPTAMTLATAAADGRPSARVVLLKGVDELGFVFFTDYRSRKGEELAANPRAALVFHWAELERQVRVGGRVARVSPEESDAYFQTRPAGSRIAAWTSCQSQVVDSRAALEGRFAELERRYVDGAIPLPPYWGGFRVAPDEIEFWQGRANRLHDRLRYARLESGQWKIERLEP